MTFSEICNWLTARQAIPQERHYSEHGRTDETTVTYANGDTYHQITTYIGYSDFDRCHTESYINGECVRSADLRYENFGWKEIKTA